MTPVESSNIAAIGHDPLASVMTVQFHAGTRYAYANVSADIFNEILMADSVGKAFNLLVKSKPDQFPYTRVA